MIESVKLENVKLLKSVDVQLGRLNMIVGRNAIGKSTLLNAISDVLALGEAGFLFDINNKEIYKILLKIFNKNVENFNINYFTLNGFCNIELQFSKSIKKISFMISSDKLEINFSDLNVNEKFIFSRYDDSVLSDEIIAFLIKLNFILKYCSHLRLHAADLAADHAADTDIPAMGPTGAGLASVLQYIQGLRDGKLEAIEADLARVVPGARRVRALPVRLQQQERVRVAINGQESWHEQQRTVTGSRFEVEFEGQGWVRAGQLSEGTLLMLGLLTVLRHRAPTLLLLDDLDRGLHPVAQREAVRLLREAMRLNPELQIVATSHSPFVLDELEADEVFVMGAVGPGESQIRRLDSHPAWERHKEFMHPGEFWSAIGEGWVGERP